MNQASKNNIKKGTHTKENKTKSKQSNRSQGGDEGEKERTSQANKDRTHEHVS